MKTILFISFLSILPLFSWAEANPTPICTCDRMADSLELVKMYNLWDGANWTNPWDLSRSLEEWEGVKLVGNCIDEISIINRGIKGQLYDLGFPDLKILEINENELQGPIPNFSKLTTLRSLLIAGTKIEGEIPDFDNFQYLVSLKLHKSNVSGEIPDFSNLTALERLNIIQTKVSGLIPNFSNLQNLKFLWLTSNELQGQIPDFFLPNLITLYLDDNQLSGSFPSLVSCPLLTEISASSNQITGNIPGFDVHGNLISVDLNSNKLEGKVPSFSNSPYLRDLYLHYNNLDDIEGFSQTSIRQLNLERNQIAADLIELNLPNTIRSLKINYNLFSGDINYLFQFPEINSIEASGNPITGTFIDIPSLPNLRILDLLDTEISGPIPTMLANTKVSEFSVSSPNLLGDIPDFPTLENLKKLKIGGSQYITGQIPNFSFLNNLEHLEIFDTRNSGLIPDFLFLPMVEIISISRTTNSGKVPSFSNCRELSSLTIESTEVIGPLPDFLSLSKLSNIRIRFNRFLNGPIPTFSNNPNLNIVWLDNNALEGMIHPFSNSPLITSLDLRENMFDSCSILEPTNLRTLRLRGNLLTFDDLIPNFTSNSTSAFGPQKRIILHPSFKSDGINILVHLDIDEAIQNSTYRWELNGVPFDTTASGILSLSLANRGKYLRVFVANPQFLDFEIESYPFQIGFESPFIEGKLFLDEGNCQYDSTEIGLANWLIKLEGHNDYFCRTSRDGKYKFSVEPGSYDVIAFPPNNSWNTCNVNNTINLDFNDKVKVNIPISVNTQCSELQVNLGIQNALFRRCFDNVFAVNYCNLGTVAEENIQIELKVDPWLTVDSIDQRFTSLGNGRYIVQMDSLSIGECKTALVYFTPQCDAPLSLEQSIQAHIRPDTLCSSLSSLWSGATIDTDGSCNGTDVKLVLRNVGNDISDTLFYRVFKDGVLINEDIYQLSAGDSLLLSYTADGSSYRLESDQEPNHPCSVISSTSVEGCDNGMANISTGYALQFPNQTDFCPFDDQLTYPIIGSYDPNDKQAFPTGYGPEHFITPETKIEYLIRFQNVGNDTAFTVKILDTLSTYLDVSTLKILDASHSYQVMVDTNQVMEFTFYDIELVDSTTNEPASHGFVRFAVYPKVNTDLGTSIINRASIYFDFNAPIHTNEVFHTLGRDFIQDEATPAWIRQPEDLNLDCSNMANLEDSIQTWLNNFGGGLANDFCSPVNYGYEQSEFIEDCGLTGYYDVLFIISDNCGNVDTIQRQINIVDTIPPIWIMEPQNLIIDCKGDYISDINTWLDDFGNSIFDEPCGIAGISFRVIDSLDCSKYDSVSVVFEIVDDCGNTASHTAYIITDNLISTQNLSSHRFDVIVYPNPTNGKTTIFWKGLPQSFDLEIFDRQGRLLEKDNGFGNNHQIDVSGFPKGLAYLRIIGNHEVIGVGRLMVD